MLTLTPKLAFAGMRSRRLQGILSVLVVAVATAALTIASAVGRVAERPFERTLEATNGAHVTVGTSPGGPSLLPLEQLPGVVASTGPLPDVIAAFLKDGRRYGLRLLEFDRSAAVSRPLLVDGTLPNNGEILVERSFAAFHHVRPGSRLSTPRGTLTVSGVMIVPSGEAYPMSQPGLGMANERTLAELVPDRARWGSIIGLRLADPERAPAVAAAIRQRLGDAAFVETWQEARADSAAIVRTVSVILSLFGSLLLLSAGAVLATLVGGRILAQTREIGLLKAIGLTPGQVTRVLVLEQVTLALVGIALGLLAALLLTPIFTSPSASLLNASETPTLDAARIALLALVVLALVSLFTVVPGLRASRRTTAETLTAGRSGGARRSRLGAAVDRFGRSPVVGIGARGSFVRRGRTLLTVLTLSLTVASAVATLGMEASLRVATDPGVAPLIQGTETPLFDPVDDDAGEGDRLRPVVYSFDALLLFVGLVNLVATLLLTTRERVRDFGLLKAVGLTPRQVSGSLVAEQVLIGLLAGLVGVPLGLGLFRLGIGLSGGADEFAYPSWWSLVLLVPAVMVLVTALAAPLARRAAALSVADALRYE